MKISMIRNTHSLLLDFNRNNGTKPHGQKIMGKQNNIRGTSKLSVPNNCTENTCMFWSKSLA